MVLSSGSPPSAHSHERKEPNVANLKRTPPAIAPLIERLSRHEVRYVVFGSGGAWCYGANVSHGDFDICPDLDDANLARVAAVLVAIHARPRVIPGWMTPEVSAAWMPEPATDVNLDHLFETDLGDFDVVPCPYGPNGKSDRFDYQRLYVGSAAVEVAGLPVYVAGIDDLIASKLSQRRAKDLEALPELERIRRPFHGD
jgi:hypothetical protein